MNIHYIMKPQESKKSHAKGVIFSFFGDFLSSLYSVAEGFMFDGKSNYAIAVPNMNRAE